MSVLYDSWWVVQHNHSVSLKVKHRMTATNTNSSQTHTHTHTHTHTLQNEYSSPLLSFPCNATTNNSSEVVQLDYFAHIRYFSFNGFCAGSCSFALPLCSEPRSPVCLDCGVSVEWITFIAGLPGDEISHLTMHSTIEAYSLGDYNEIYLFILPI